MTKVEWDEKVNENQVCLRELISEFHPYYKRTHSMKITAPKAEVFCEGIRQNDATVVDPLETFDKALLAKDREALLSLFNSTWFGIPESTECRSIDGFFVLCDLCSVVIG